jgi:hypothetical protein
VAPFDAEAFVGVFARGAAALVLGFVLGLARAEVTAGFAVEVLGDLAVVLTAVRTGIRSPG